MPELSGEDNVKTPVVALKLAVIFPVLALLANDNTSSPGAKLAMATVAFSSVLLSGSVKVMVELIIAAAPFSEYAIVVAPEITGTRSAQPILGHVRQSQFPTLLPFISC